MDSYILKTVDYDYKPLNHEGFGGICKYIATQKSEAVLRKLFLLHILPIFYWFTVSEFTLAGYTL